MKLFFLFSFFLPLLFVFNTPTAQDSFTPVTPALIQERLQTSSAKNIHPRLFFNRQDIERIKKLNQQGDTLVKLGSTQIVNAANEILKQPLLEYFLDEAKLRVPSVHKFATQLPSLVMAYQLTGDTVYAFRVWQQMKLMSDYADWGADRHFLDAGIGAFNFALAYDGLYNYFSNDQRRQLRQTIKKFVLQPGKEQLSKKIWWSTANHNWNGICNGGIIMACLALFEEEPEDVSNIISMAVNALPKYIAAFEPDGQSEEGLMYWSYGLMYTTIAFESMQRTMDTVFNLDQFPGFKKTGWFPAFMSGPVTSLSVGDDPVKDARSRSFFWFAKNYQDTALAKMQYDLCLETNTVSWTDLLYYNPQMLQGKSIKKEMSLDNHVRGIEMMSLRSGWEKQDMFVSMHGGNNDANHGHLDAGSFDVQAFGEVWAYGNLGRDEYTSAGYFSKETLPGYFDTNAKQTVPGRWHFYRLRAEGKNCIVVNPSARPDQNEKGQAAVVRSGSTKEKGFYILNLTDCYIRDAKNYQRGINLNREKKIITIQDEFQLHQPSDIWWQMHTKAVIQISKDKRTAILQQNGKKLKVRIKNPVRAIFKELPATYLPGQLFPLTRNGSNKEYRKLVIALQNVKEEIISIELSAVDNPGIKNQDLICLENW